MLEQPEEAGLLQFRNRFRSRDADEVHAYVSNLFCQHELGILRRAQHLDTRIGRTDLGNIRFVSLHHGAPVRVTADSLEDYILQIPLGGSGRAMIGRTEMPISDRMAYIMSPNSKFLLEFSSECGHLIVQIDKRRCEHFHRNITGRESRGPLSFMPMIDLADPRAAQVTRLIRLIAAEAGQPSSCLDANFVATQAESLILSLMMANLSSGNAAGNDATPAMPVYVRRAQAYLQENIENPISIEQLAVAARASASSLYAGFRLHLNMSPMAYLKAIRLEYAHRELSANDCTTTSVSRVATKCGFNHFGNFATDYRRHFGELPSDTLRRSR